MSRVLAPLYLTMIRHGEVSLPAPDLLYGDHDVNLSPAALAVMPRLAEVLAARQPQIVLTSQLKRCAALARSVADLSGARLVRDARLRERHIGEWRLKARSEVRDDPVYQRFAAGDPDAVPPGGESLRMLQARFMAAIHTLLSGNGAAGSYRPADSVQSVHQRAMAASAHAVKECEDVTRVVWVSHGGVIRSWRCHVHGVDIADSLQFSVGYFDVMEFRRDATGRWHEEKGPHQLLDSTATA